jgi:hypothetical protein
MVIRYCFNGRGRRGPYHEVLQEGIPSLKVYVRSSGQVCSLLKEHRFLSEYFADVDGDFLNVMG